MRIVDDKRALRRTLKAKLSTLPPLAFVHAGIAVAAALDDWLWSLSPLSSPPTSTTSTTVTSPGPTVALFASRDDEIDIRPLEAKVGAFGLQIAVPRIDGDELVFHVVDDFIHRLPVDGFGIPTPPTTLPTVALRDCAVVVVPGLAFDERGGRLGYGRGFYDRALAGLAGGVDLERVVAIGLDEQVVAHVPVDTADIRLRWLCTPRGLRRTGGDVDNVDNVES